MNIKIKNNYFVLGGCRSGKSSHALSIANHIQCKNKYFIATLKPYDKEMEQRVLSHQKQRDKSFITIEETEDIVSRIKENDSIDSLFLIDCLTLWITNLILNNNTDVFLEAEKLISSIKEIKAGLIFVSNEVGCGIVPENQLARQFRDIAGFVNQKMAKNIENVVWMVAGIPIIIKDNNKHVFSKLL